MVTGGAALGGIRLFFFGHYSIEVEAREAASSRRGKYWPEEQAVGKETKRPENVSRRVVTT